MPNEIGLIAGRRRNRPGDQGGEPDGIAFVGYGVCRDDAVTKGCEALKGIVREYSMHHSNHGPDKALQRKHAGGLNQCTA